MAPHRHHVFRYLPSPFSGPICLTPRAADDDFVSVFFCLQQFQQYETLRFVLSVGELPTEAFKVRVVKESVHFVHADLLPSLLLATMEKR
jgi:hypothetical protein